MLSRKELRFGTLMFAALGLCFFALVGARTANGQATSGTVNGYITDPSGAVCAGSAGNINRGQ